MAKDNEMFALYFYSANEVGSQKKRAEIFGRTKNIGFFPRLTLDDCAPSARNGHTQANKLLSLFPGHPPSNWFHMFPKSRAATGYCATSDLRASLNNLSNSWRILTDLGDAFSRAGALKGARHKKRGDSDGDGDDFYDTRATKSSPLFFTGQMKAEALDHPADAVGNVTRSCYLPHWCASREKSIGEKCCRHLTRARSGRAFN